MKMASINSYQLKSGETRYMFKLDHGINPSTGKSIKTIRRSFKTKKEAELAYLSLKLEAQNRTFQNKLVLVPEKRNKNNQDNYYTREQLLEFLSCCKKENNKMYYAFYRLLGFSGVRTNEAYALTWEDIDFENNTILINKSFSYGGKHANNLRAENWRIILIDSKTIDVLKEWREEQQQFLQISDFKAIQSKQIVFNNQKNGYLNVRHGQVWLDKILEKYDLKHITTHGYRVSHAQVLTEAGACSTGIQQRLGRSIHGVTTAKNIQSTEKIQMDTLQKLIEYMLHNKTISPDVRG
ncbi:tyrosine-type recombinase/integrase [Psychrobacillus sp. NPDC096389]|uniref:site-specific integrase n=1 Tax=Psychrobacillus sp. NPDC096389 TaxID=3364490 RepID=UPI003825E963